MVGVGRQEAEASLLELVERTAGCLRVDEEQRVLVLTQVRILPVEEGEVRACLVEH